MVNDGYVIERAGVRSDGEPLYNVYYRLVLKNTDTMSAEYRKVEVKTESLKQPVPVISDEYEQDGDSVTFRWERQTENSSAKYQVNLTGVREDGSESESVQPEGKQRGKPYTDEASIGKPVKSNTAGGYQILQKPEEHYIFL